MNFEKPVVVYTAKTNVEAHLIVKMLENNGVPAYAVEDQSGASLFSFGILHQFHKPKIWVDEVMFDQAAKRLQDFEEKNRTRNALQKGSEDINAVCEECGKTTAFAYSLDGTTQECLHCGSYLDVGELPWEEDFGVAEE